MPLPDSLEFGLTALPGDYYLRLPVLGSIGVTGALNDPLVMVDGLAPDLFPDLEVLEPEERHEGLFPIVVRTVICVARERLAPWIEGSLNPPEATGLARAMTDDDIVGVLYWGSEDERWRLRRVCIGRYSRFEDLDDTSELDSMGAFRDWLLVQSNQFQAWTLFRNGWSDYNTTDLKRLMPFLQRYVNANEHVLSMRAPENMIVGAAFDHRKTEEELKRRTSDQRWGVKMTFRWELETGRLERLEDKAVRV